MVDGKSTTKIMRMAREEQQELFGSGKSGDFKMDLTNDDEFPSLGGAPAEEFDEEDEQFEDFDGNEGNFYLYFGNMWTEPFLLKTTVELRLWADFYGKCTNGLS